MMLNKRSVEARTLHSKFRHKDVLSDCGKRTNIRIVRRAASMGDLGQRRV